jgi:hypothetical protein
MRRQEDGTYRLPPGQPQAPMMFSLRGFVAGPGLRPTWETVRYG